MPVYIDCLKYWAQTPGKFPDEAAVLHGPDQITVRQQWGLKSCCWTDGIESHDPAHAQHRSRLQPPPAMWHVAHRGPGYRAPLLSSCCPCSASLLALWRTLRTAMPAPSTVHTKKVRTCIEARAPAVGCEGAGQPRPSITAKPSKLKPSGPHHLPYHECRRSGHEQNMRP